MKNLLHFTLIILLAVLLTACSHSDDILVIDDHNTTTPTPVDDNAYKIFFISMDLADDFWLSIDSGCRKAVSELGAIDYKWIAPDTNLDSSQQLCIQQAIDSGAHAILLAASSPTGVNETLEKAQQAGVKIIFLDNPADFDCIAFLATDNERAGFIAGETLQKALAEAGINSGKIGLMVNKSNVTSTALRVDLKKETQPQRKEVTSWNSSTAGAP